MLIRSIAKVADAYTLNKRTKRIFKPLGTIAYIPFIKGEADLVYKKGKFFPCQTIDVPEEKAREVEDFIGCDFGIRDIVVSPRYTSQTCTICKHFGKRTDKHFRCNNCGSHMDADTNASLNIATLDAAVGHA